MARAPNHKPKQPAGSAPVPQGAASTAPGFQMAARDLPQRSDELDQFVSRVAHDLKSPLVTLSGFVGILRQSLAQKDERAVESALERIAAAAARMNRLVDDLLTMTRASQAPMSPSPTSLESLLRDRLRLIRTRMEARNVRAEIHGPLPTLQIDPRRVAEALDNLLSNAVKYGVSESGGHVEVSAWQTPELVCIGVRDHGPGVPEQHCHRIFQLFERLDTRQEGTGVGLAIVSKLMEQHAGRAWVEPAAGGGAQFVLGFPLSTLVAGGSD